jgi:hypothetical protein
MNAPRTLLFGFASIALLALAYGVQACPFCPGGDNETLALEIDKAQMVIFGHFENPKRGNGGLGDGQSDFVIERVYKNHDMLTGLKQVNLPRYIDSKSKFLVFADVYKGKIDPYKGVELASGAEMTRYIEGLLHNKQKTQPERLRFAFDFLNSDEIEVNMDAYREFARADYADYKDMAKKLPADKIAGWLRDAKTPSYRYGLYASLLGHCGNQDHAKLLLEMINDPEKRKGSGLHGLMASYVMLEPQKGWAFVQDVVKQNERPFLVRYAGLQTMRFLRESRPDLVNAKDEADGKNQIVKAVASILAIQDMCDFAIEDLRKWQRWEYCDQILAMQGQKNFSTPIIRKSILRYALQCPTPAARKFVEAERVRDAEYVDETRELLELETPLPPAKK